MGGQVLQAKRLFHNWKNWPRGELVIQSLDGKKRLGEKLRLILGRRMSG